MRLLAPSLILGLPAESIFPRQNHQLSLSAVNSSKSAFCLFLLEADKFFHRYELTGEAAQGGGGIKCKLLVKVSVPSVAVIRTIVPTCTRTSKSVMSVLGRGNQSQSVDTLQLQIIDAQGVAPTRRRKPPLPRRKGLQRVRDQVADEEEDELDEGRASIQAKLVLVLNCKHGKSSQGLDIVLASHHFYPYQASSRNTPSTSRPANVLSPKSITAHAPTTLSFPRARSRTGSIISPYQAATRPSPHPPATAAADEQEAQRSSMRTSSVGSSRRSRSGSRRSRRIDRRR